MRGFEGVDSKGEKESAAGEGIATGTVHIGTERQLRDAIADHQLHASICITRDLTLSDSIVIDRPVHLVGVGMPVLSVASLASHRGIIVTKENTTIDGLCFRNGSAITGNGAGIWHDRGKLVVRNCRFEDNQNGILVATSPSVTVQRSIFDQNGAGCGHTHGLYLNSVDHARIENCVFRDTAVGHHLKSRAKMIDVTGCYFSGKPSSSTSCAIDLAKAGTAHIRRNQIVKTCKSMSRYFISVAAEGAYADQHVAIDDNLFITQRRWLSVAVKNYSRKPLSMSGNAYENRIVHRLGAGSESNVVDSQLALHRGLHGSRLND